MGEPGGLLSMGSHRVGHDWSDLAAAAVAARCDNLQDGTKNSATLSKHFLCLSAGKESSGNVVMWETWVRSLGWDPGEGKGYPPQYSGLENSMKWTPTGSQRVGHNWATFTVAVTLSKWMVGLFPSVSMFSKLFSIKFIPCHYMKVSWSQVAQSCPTLCDPMDHSLPGSSVHGIFQARILEWVAISFSRGSSQPRDWTQVSRIIGRCFYPLSQWGSPLYGISCQLKYIQLCHH